MVERLPSLTDISDACGRICSTERFIFCIRGLLHDRIIQDIEASPTDIPLRTIDNIAELETFCALGTPVSLITIPEITQAEISSLLTLVAEDTAEEAA